MRLGFSDRGASLGLLKALLSIGPMYAVRHPLKKHFHERSGWIESNLAIHSEMVTLYEDILTKGWRDGATEAVRSREI